MINKDTVLTGRAWLFGDNVSTDSIAPGRLIGLRSNPKEFAKHVLEEKRPEFPGSVKPGDLLIAGTNFGCGSSREIAPIIIKESGIAAILAKSFGRIFYRNAINNGMLVIECDTDAIEDGQTVTISMADMTIRIAEKPDYVEHFTFSEHEANIVSKGGLLNYLEENNGYGK